MERRRKATTHLNPELSMLVEDEESFIDAAPLLFGKGFDQRARDHTEAIKSLKKTTSFSGNQSSLTELPRREKNLISHFRGATPHSPGEVAYSGAGGQRNLTELPRRGKELNKSYFDCTNKIINNLINCHHMIEQTPTTEVVTNTKVSNRIINTVKKSSQWVRGHPNSPGVRDHTYHDNTLLSEYNSGSTYSSPDVDSVEPLMDSTDEDGHSPYCLSAM